MEQKKNMNQLENQVQQWFGKRKKNKLYNHVINDELNIKEISKFIRKQSSLNRFNSDTKKTNKQKKNDSMNSTWTMTLISKWIFK